MGANRPEGQKRERQMKKIKLPVMDRHGDESTVQIQFGNDRSVYTLGRQHDGTVSIICTPSSCWDVKWTPPKIVTHTQDNLAQAEFCQTSLISATDVTVTITDNSGRTCDGNDPKLLARIENYPGLINRWTSPEIAHMTDAEAAEQGALL